mmetsp:Transcript_65728/g.77262  ORF Transcript_65728/g.77262 Transcript_65728/m.77262 type:complete len:475 (+) Transcript_65728:38-1462(+)
MTTTDNTNGQPPKTTLEENDTPTHPEKSNNSQQEAIRNVLTSASLSPTSEVIAADPRVPSISASAVLGESDEMPAGTPQVSGYDFNRCTDGRDSIEGTATAKQQLSNAESDVDVLGDLLTNFGTMGFQATTISQAIHEINRMRSWRLSDVPVGAHFADANSPELEDPTVRSQIRAKIFLSYTSNQISCGQRETIRFLVEHNMVDVICTTAGGIEEDIIKCLKPSYMGDFKLRGSELRKKGLNRIGNLIVPNYNYCLFEDWFSPLLTKMHDEQDESIKEFIATKAAEDDGVAIPSPYWTPSRVIDRLGAEINDESSVLYWAHKHQIPVFCPALTDGSIGDMMYFHTYKRPGFVLDTVGDIRRINDEAVQSYATGMIILGGGVVKHHVCNANLMRNGADFAVFVNTAHEFDGSDSGASPDEAVSWGKIRMEAKPVKVCCDATIAFPLIVSQTFAKGSVSGWKQSVKDTRCWLGSDE